MMATKADDKAQTKKASDESKTEGYGNEDTFVRDTNLTDRPTLEQPEVTPEIVEAGHDEKVKATDDTRVNMDELNGDNIVEKLTDNPVARSNREQASIGRVKTDAEKK
jgi:hypothetical protein